MSINLEEAQTRLLLFLWNMEEKEVLKGKLTTRLKRGKEKASIYQPVFEKLIENGGIILTKKGRSITVSLTDKGEKILADGLQSDEFGFNGNQVSSKIANALLKWIRQSENQITTDNISTVQIQSYQEFEKIVLEVYDRINQDYNLMDLVPIYRIRREIGNQITRNVFNEWLLEMQARDILQLQGGSLPDNDPSKIEDSIMTELSGLRCYAQKL